MTQPADTALPCGHLATYATTPDNPPHDGSTWTCAWCEDLAAAQARERALEVYADALAEHDARQAERMGLLRAAEAAYEFLRSASASTVRFAAGCRDAITVLCEPSSETDEPRPPPCAGTAALDAALRKARADALRTAANTLAATCTTLGATVDLRQACQLLRRLVDDAEAGA